MVLISIIPYKITVEYDGSLYAVCDIIFQLDQRDNISYYKEQQSDVLEISIYCDDITRSLLEYIYLYYNADIRDEKNLLDFYDRTLLREIGPKKNDKSYLDY